ncbi:histone-lysine N-methyltransferase ash1 [Musca vetustissima]|uniref:histone-lysine N-methyltransferase ash1 n=1 Tax=Musca vetustissima TaxID=27455 RepID=UPI002AB771C8|nr:histone-lysine N-methyltransferase ash1 [Musca vetustissima]
MFVFLQHERESSHNKDKQQQHKKQRHEKKKNTNSNVSATSTNSSSSSTTATTTNSSSNSSSNHSISNSSSSSSSHTTSSNSSNSSNNSTNNNTHNISNIALATQFSIQRTDSDGCLRMKISAIRPTSSGSGAAGVVANNKKSPSAAEKSATKKLVNISNRNKQNTAAAASSSSLVVDSKRKKAEEQKMKSLSTTTTATGAAGSAAAATQMSVIVSPCSGGGGGVKETSISVGGGAESDITDSGCSEATNTTIATITGHEKSSKRKVKRKKALLKGALEAKRTLKTLKTLINSKQNNAFSTDSEDDEPLANKINSKGVVVATAPAQRAPRLLLTAVGVKHNSNNNTSSLSVQMMGGLNLNSVTATGAGGGSDHIGLSSSDNDLPNIRAAVERAVGDSDDDDDDDDDDLMLAHYPKTKTKHLPQYQSTLLQDFMEKTQMLGQNSKSSESVEPPLKLTTTTHHPPAIEIVTQFQNNSPADSVASPASSACVVVNKKRRGRPKKPDKPPPLRDLTTHSMSSSPPLHHHHGANRITTMTSNINESADSGVISTTSISTQSTSPHPCTTVASSASPHSPPNKTANNTPEKAHQPLMNDNAGTSTSTTSSGGKPKIDIALLDKRMYATERVLYPPPRNKRRQSMSAALGAGGGGATTADKNNRSNTQQIASTKEDLQLDPVWRKIDVNRKFRRPSVCSTTGGGGVAGGGGSSTICSKILAAKSGYVSDYGSSSFRVSTKQHSKHSHNSGYKSDASCKSRYSTKSCASRKSRAKSCGYRSDCKESVLGGTTSSACKSSKFRRKRRASIMPKTATTTLGSLKDEQDILQLAGLSLGQSSEESNEYVCKPSLEKLPTTSASKKYGEINRYIATGEYFGRGSSAKSSSFASLSSSNQARIFDLSLDLPSTPTPAKMNLHQRKNSITSEFAHDLLMQLPGAQQTARKIKSRRSSVASYCSSFYSGTTKIRKRRRRKPFRFHNSSSGKNCVIDSKLLTEIEILTNTFAARCRIQTSATTAAAATTTTGISDKVATSASGGGGNLSLKEKLMAEANKLKQSFAAAAAAAQAASTSNNTVTAGGGGSTSSSGKRGDARDKKSLKKRKMSENLDFAMLSARAEVGAASSTGTPQGGASSSSSKRRHKKASSSSPDDHKLPLKKRHYLLTPGEKSSEVAVAVAAKLFANNSEAWAAAAAAAKSTANTKSQQQFNARTAKANLTPKKRHLLQQGGAHHHPHQHHHHLQHLPHPPLAISEDSNSNKTSASTLSPLRVAVGDSISGGKLLDISPQSLNSLKQVTEAVNKKRSRLEGLVSRIATTNHPGDEPQQLPIPVGKNKHHLSSSALQIESESSSCPPPGVFEPSVELEIQIPPMAKLTDSSTAGIITKSEIESPLLMDLNKPFGGSADMVTMPPSKPNGQRGVVESLLNKTGGNLILKRKRKKINRTGFPTVRRKKRKVQENLILDVIPTAGEDSSQLPSAGGVINNQPTKCDRVPQEGETSQTFMERNNRTPRLSVVALERLQESPQSQKEKLEKDNGAKEKAISAADPATPKSRHARREVKRKDSVAQKLLSKSMPAKLLLHEEEEEEDDDNKPLASRAKRRSKPPPPPPPSRPSKGESKEITNKSATLNQRKTPAAISKTVKSLLDANIKLPAGIDPSSLMSCKIKLKRRNSIHPLAMTNKCPTTVVTTPSTPKRQPSLPLEIEPSAEEIEINAASKDCNENYEEHDILPLNENIYHIANAAEGAEQSDASEEKSTHSSSTTTSSSSSKKTKLGKKSYLVAGLFSDYYKVTQQPSTNGGKKEKANTKKEAAGGGDNKKPEANGGDKVADQPPAKDIKESNETAVTPTLPPPPYCEKYFRRSQYDFELPYDIWWAYTNSKLPSRNTVASWNFRKIRTNIYAENVKPPPIAAYDHPMCNCKPDMGCGDNCLNRMVYTECSPSNCPTREKCRNQKIQKHEIAPGVERFMTENKGWGVRTKLPIPKGTYILEYVGEVVTEREFKDRMASIYLNDTHHYCLHLDGGLVIDGHRMGSDCRFVNHSCEPNCEIQKWSVNGLSRMALFAKRPIQEGEELTYDYNFSLFNPSEGQPCRCNTPNCRGVIGGKSQRIKPLPIEAKTPNETPSKGDAKGRQRKRKAKKNTQRQTTKDAPTPTRMHPLSERERKFVKQYSIFLVRNFEKIRAMLRRGGDKSGDSKTQTPQTTPATSPSPLMPGAISQRRPSTPASLAAQITALCTARNIKTRGLTLAVQDPELEKMAKMAKILRDICTNLEAIRSPDNNEQPTQTQSSSSAAASPSLVSLTISNSSLAGANKKKKASLKSQQKSADHCDFKSIQSNVEQGFYKQPSEFNMDMEKLFKETRVSLEKNEPTKLQFLDLLEKSFMEEKQKQYSALLEILGDESLLKDFKDKATETAAATTQNTNEEIGNNTELPSVVDHNMSNLTSSSAATSNEDIIRCICGLYKDEGLMIQCARCMVWQHTECTKADVKADNYLCERCEPREVDREIPLDDFTEEGHRYYLTLMRGKDLQVRQGDAVYVLRDIPVKDDAGNVVPSKKHTYETIGEIDYNECDIFRVERLWKDDKGERFIFGHHFLRPHETFHEPSRKFYPNEVVRVPLYEVVPINLVIGRCWVLDRTTFCKGRPIECNDETHCFICELRVDKSARFFSKAKTNHPTCTKSYAFRKFAEKLRISKTYAPHDVDPALLKSKKQKTDSGECPSIASNSPTTAAAATAENNGSGGNTKSDTNKTLHNSSTSKSKQRQNSKSPATIMPTTTPAAAIPSPKVTLKEKRFRLENVLKSLKQRQKLINPMTNANETPLDLSYLLSGRGARQRKTPLAIRKDFV